MFPFVNFLNLNTSNIVISAPLVWSFGYFFLFMYLFVTMTVALYLISGVSGFTSRSNYRRSSSFTFLSGFDLLPILVTPLLVFFVMNWSWVGPVTISWFGHLVFDTFQLRVGYLMFFFFTAVIVTYATVLYFSSQEVYDYIIVIFSFFVWLFLLFCSNNLFTVMFFIEILTTLVMLMLVTSVFSSAYFYNNLSLVDSSYAQNSTPFSFLKTLLFFFWISLVSSLNLFIFLVIFYTKFLTFEWALIETVFNYVVSASEFKAAVSAAMSWFILLFCIFLKCGLVPFYFWKPTFFKGMPIHALFFYVFYYYFFLMLFFLYFMLVYMGDLFYYSTIVSLVVITLGGLVLATIMCESQYVKAFLAMSSIINTLFVFLATTSVTVGDVYFNL